LSEIVLNEQYGLWVPADEPRLLQKDWFEKTIKTVGRDTEFVVKHSKKYDVCVQAGACFGIWPKHLSGIYGTVVTFEPDPVLFECVQKNTDSLRVMSINAALGAKHDSVYFYRYKHGTGTTVPNPNNLSSHKYKVHQITIDSLDLEACDAIFLDIERGEPDALRGAMETIRKFMPPIQVELHDKSKEEIHDVLVSMGYELMTRVGSRDAVYMHV
jgi:FkbM family methyltransferase